MSKSGLERRDRRALGRGVDQFENQIHPEEIRSINRRRAELDRPGVALVDKKVVDTVGLALSGGGVRSAALSLGVLQALNQHNVIRNIDYLSTVSGGGYIGSALTATLTKTEGEFVFGDEPPPPGSPAQTDISDTDQVGHIRNYSNYLIPFGFRDVMTGAAIVVRGLAANLGLVLPVILLAAWLTVTANPTRDSLENPDFFGLERLPLIPDQNFGFTIVVALILLFAFFLWAIRRSFLKVNKLPEFRTRWPAIFGWFLATLAIVAFMDFQPAVLDSMFDAFEKTSDSSESLLARAFASWKEWLLALIAPITTVVTLFNKYFADVIKSGKAGEEGWKTTLSVVTARAAVWVAGAALPLLLWLAYLYLCFWAIPSEVKATAPETPVATTAAECPPQATDGAVKLSFEFGALSGSAEGTLTGEPPAECPAGTTDKGTGTSTASTTATPPDGSAAKPAEETTSLSATQESAAKKEKKTGETPLEFAHRPVWLNGLADLAEEAPGWICRALGWPATSTAEDQNKSDPSSKPVAWLYFGIGLLIGLLALLLRPNANSLSRLYQDRLSKAFLFDPRSRRGRDGITKGRDFEPLDIQLSELDNVYAPYHLLNAAVNVQGSDFVNRRGRNADFFLFSPRYVGSPATGYAKTEFYEPDPPDLDLGKALSISGAAFSSAMGSKSIRALAPTLALLNVRLGYWLANPLLFANASPGRRRLGGPRLAPFYVLKEMIGSLDEKSKVVYVTDGGHIENTGIYELLRRRCKLIVVVDADADPTMDFPSFVDLQRYARIDLGVRIRIPWKEISDATGAWMGASSPSNLKPSVPAAFGPHVAVGTIEYGGKETGYLVYVKASLTGDENDYIKDYARRNPRFPHETTGDQFFSEEQFEVYRALGFHAIGGFLDGSAGVLVDTRLPQPPNTEAAASPEATPPGAAPQPTPPTASQATSETAAPASNATAGEAPATETKADASAADASAAAQSAVPKELAVPNPGKIIKGDDPILAEIRKLLGI